MKITYSAPVRPHPYQYASAFNRAGSLHKFVSGFSRLSPRASLPDIGNRLERKDFFWTLYLACLKGNLPDSLTGLIHNWGNSEIDRGCYAPAKMSDIFLYYRTTGMNTARKLKAEHSHTICVMEEVNSHIEFANTILRREFSNLYPKHKFRSDYDYCQRLEAYDGADYILCPSNFVRNSFISQGIDKDKLLTVNFGFPPVRHTQPKLVDNSVFRVLYVGQIHYRKGLRYAIKAFERLKHQNKEFVIVGPKTDYTGLDDISIPAKVSFTGILKGAQLNELYSKASIFILPSLEEGLALVQGEALTFGTPLLITENTGGSDIIRDGCEGFIVPPADEMAIYEKMEQMASNSELLQEMSYNALQAAHKLGNWDIAGQKFLDFFQPKIKNINH